MKIHFTWQGPDGDYPKAIAAAAAWNACPGVQLDVTPDPDGVPVTPVSHIEIEGVSMLGATDRKFGQPKWIEYVPSSHTQHVLMHEFGHALGLEHSSDPDDVMFPSSADSTYVRPEDCP